jgi:hypothetical protein
MASFDHAAMALPVGRLEPDTDFACERSGVIMQKVHDLSARFARFEG